MEEHGEMPSAGPVISGVRPPQDGWKYVTKSAYMMLEEKAAPTSEEPAKVWCSHWNRRSRLSSELIQPRQMSPKLSAQLRSMSRTRKNGEYSGNVQDSKARPHRAQCGAVVPCGSSLKSANQAQNKRTWKRKIPVQKSALLHRVPVLTRALISVEARLKSVENGQKHLEMQTQQRQGQWRWLHRDWDKRLRPLSAAGAAQKCISYGSGCNGNFSGLNISRKGSEESLWPGHT